MLQEGCSGASTPCGPGELHLAIRGGFSLTLPRARPSQPSCSKPSVPMCPYSRFLPVFSILSWGKIVSLIYSVLPPSSLEELGVQCCLCALAVLPGLHRALTICEGKRSTFKTASLTGLGLHLFGHPG